jgi:hypothetical protein
VYIVIPHIPPKPAANEKYTSIIRRAPCTAEIASSERTYWYHTGTYMIKEEKTVFYVSEIQYTYTKAAPCTN